MNANDLAIQLDAASSDMEYNYHVSDWKLLSDAAEMLRAQAEKINNLEQWQKRQLDVIEAQKEYMKAQDKHIVDLAFKLVYAERGNEVAKELSNERK